MKVFAVGSYLFLCFVLGTLAQAVFDSYDAGSWVQVFSLGCLLLLVVVATSATLAFFL
jgi:hypothetical protein